MKLNVRVAFCRRLQKGYQLLRVLLKAERPGIHHVQLLRRKQRSQSPPARQHANRLGKCGQCNGRVLHCNFCRIQAVGTLRDARHVAGEEDA